MRKTILTLLICFVFIGMTGCSKEVLKIPSSDAGETVENQEKEADRGSISADEEEAVSEEAVADDEFDYSYHDLKYFESKGITFKVNESKFEYKNTLGQVALSGKEYGFKHTINIMAFSNRKDSVGIMGNIIYYKDGQEIGRDDFDMTVENDAFSVDDIDVAEEDFDSYELEARIASLDTDNWKGAGSDLDIHFDIDPERRIISGTVENNTNETIIDPTVYFALMDSNQNVLEKVWTWPKTKDYRGIEPGEKAEFDIDYHYDKEFEECRAWVNGHTE